MTVRNPLQTRDRILVTAFHEIHAHGFQGMRVDEVLRQSGLQKGAFYHHFGSKAELGYAVLEEQILPLIQSVWLVPLSESKNPVEDIPRMLDSLDDRITPAMREHGCPLNNLAQEMATQDEGFRIRIAAIFEEWINAFTEVFERGKAQGYINAELDSRAAARFVIAVLEGCIGVFKVDHSPEQWTACRTQLASYFVGLSPARGAKRGAKTR